MNRLYADLAALRMRWALATIVLKAGFDPTQPRLPRGMHGGGRWLGDEDGGGGGDTTEVIPAAVRSGSKVDLLAEERAGGHTISEHVGKSPAYLLNRVNQVESVETPFATFEAVPERAGSFPSVPAAEKLVNSTLSQNSLTVSLIANGLLSSQFVTSTFDSKTGIEAFRPSANSQPYLRDTYGVGVLIRYDRNSARGFRVVTAYPRNDR